MKNSLLTFLVFLLVALGTSAQKGVKQPSSAKATKTTTTQPAKSTSAGTGKTAAHVNTSPSKTPDVRVTTKSTTSKPPSNKEATTKENHKSPQEKESQEPERATEMTAPHQSDVQEERAPAPQDEEVPIPLPEDEVTPTVFCGLPITEDGVIAIVALNPDVYHYMCFDNCSYCCRCNSLWYYWWYNQLDKECNWTGDVTLVNTTKDTLELYTEKHDAVDMPTTEVNANSSIANKENYTFLILIPGDSLTFKMPCGALKYEAIEKRDSHSGYLKRKIGWVRTVSYDVRVEIKEEEMD